MTPERVMEVVEVGDYVEVYNPSSKDNPVYAGRDSVNHFIQNDTRAKVVSVETYKNNYGELKVKIHVKGQLYNHNSGLVFQVLYPNNIKKVLKLRKMER